MPYLAAAIVTAGVVVPRVRETRKARAAAAKLDAAETAVPVPMGAPPGAPAPGIDPAMIAR